jgi:hypothetical protein
MLFHPGVMALLAASVITALMVIYSAYHGYVIVRRWDLESGSELQLSLERRTYLISTILTYAFAFQMFSLLLFVYTADNLHGFFTGAMCAAGTLNVNEYGYPALLLKTFTFLFAGVWLIVNHVDNRGYDYPLTRRKCLLLLVLMPLVVAEAIALANFFLRLDPNIITSCCGSLFSTDARSIGSDLASLPPRPMMVLFCVTTGTCLASGLYFVRKGKGAYLFGLLATATLVVSVLSLISFVSVYFYELPSHHCPFCIFQGEYSYVGYPLYVALLGGAVSGMGVGVLEAFRGAKSLQEILPSVQKRLAIACLVFYAAFAALVAYGITASHLILQPY